MACCSIKNHIFCVTIVLDAIKSAGGVQFDIGCGEGKDAVFFARCGYMVSAFDLSEVALEKNNSSGIPHKHAANRLFARNIKEIR